MLKRYKMYYNETVGKIEMLYSNCNVPFVFFQVVTFLCLSNRIVRTCRWDYRAVSSYLQKAKRIGRKDK